jgi:hypothetical protein
VRFHQVPSAAFKARLTGSGMSEAMVQEMLHIGVSSECAS